MPNPRDGLDVMVAGLLIFAGLMFLVAIIIAWWDRQKRKRK